MSMEGAKSPREAVGGLHLRVSPRRIHEVSCSKGSVAIDGISLTVAKVNKASFDLWIILILTGLPLFMRGR